MGHVADQNLPLLLSSNHNSGNIVLSAGDIAEISIFIYSNFSPAADILAVLSIRAVDKLFVFD